MNERFYVTTVSGFRKPERQGARMLPGLSAHVLDRVFNCEVVATYRSEEIAARLHRREGADTEAVLRAEMHAKHLNAVYG